MLEDKMLQVFLFISLAAHTAILLQNPTLFIFNKTAEKPKQIEVHYMKSAPPRPFALPDLDHKAQPLSQLPKKITLEKTLLAPFQEKSSSNEVLKNNLDMLRDRSLPAVVKPALIKLDAITIKKKIILPQMDSDKVNNPSYINYFQLVREKIRRAAYHNYSGTQTGEIHISFVIGNDGVLRDIKFQDDRSTADAYLTQISLKSVRDSGPFPSFPKELDYPQLSFNVAISYGIE
ncbi:MAG: hypothetical protein PHN57_07535 [Candidatus Omnitrophica bacterium]|nr:hypothetical protein [Candidatus Omnitrophota bacterium]